MLFWLRLVLEVRDDQALHDGEEVSVAVRVDRGAGCGVQAQGVLAIDAVLPHLKVVQLPDGNRRDLVIELGRGPVQ